MKGKIILAFILIAVSIIPSVYAHGGQTDINGGHYNRSTGEYHYHHGYSAHQHIGGVCPYDYHDQTGINSGSPSTVSSTSQSTVFDQNSYEKGYDSGYAEGHERGRAEYESEISERLDAARAEGYTEGYEDKATESDGIIEEYKTDLAVSEESSKNKTLYGYVISAIAVIASIGWIQNRKNLLSLQELSRKNIAFLQRQYDDQAVLLEDANNKLRALQIEHRKLEHTYDKALNQLRAISSNPVQAIEQPKAVTFGHWPPEIHHSEKQLKKYRKAKTEQMKVVKIDDSKVRVFTSPNHSYFVTFNSCTCRDFIYNERRQAPCKHIYFAAIRAGVPLHDIFGE